MISVYIALAVFAAAATLYGFLSICKSQSKAIGALFKSIATFSACIPACTAFIQNGKTEVMLLALGIIASGIADFVICYSFLGGAVSFMLAHSLFIASFILVGGLSYTSLIIFAVFAVAVSFFIYKLLPLGKMLVPGILYTVIIGTMFSIAFPMAFTGKTSGIMLSIGALLFVISDCILAKCSFKGRRLSLGILLMVFYYASELLFGTSTVFI